MQITLKEIRYQTATVLSLIFTKPPGFSFKAGQFLRWTFPVDACDQRCNTRNFSVASSPTEDFLMCSFRIGVSALKRAIPNFAVGTKVSIIGPLGRFILDDTNLPIVILAGGVGITPVRSMLKYISDTKSPRLLTLLYSNHTPAEIAFKEDMDRWSSTDLNLNIVHTITRPTESDVWTGRTGRINEAMVNEYTKDIKTTQFYTCGPPKMVDSIRTMLANMGIPEEHLHSERFTGY
ncbi:FAD-dependent oxidoreductase [Candidatus Woesebacteria bacterium]|nr:FAD-dependent oxidoreductase [Candidatus Woesebacteria bacterium]